MLALAAALAASCEARLCNGEALAPFLARLESGAGVHILQLGDSHTAGDAITSAWRARLQARRGDGGRGVLAPGRPYAGYLTWGVTASESGGWRTGTWLRPDGAPVGLGGFTRTARRAGATLRVDADTGEFDRMIVCALTGPGAGTIRLSLGTAFDTWPLDAGEPGSACRTLDSETPAVTAEIVTEDAGEVGITSFATFRREGGAVLSNLGVVGARLSHFARADEAVLRAELGAYRPDLIVLAFGTNEGFDAGLSLDAYEETLRTQVTRLRLLAGEDVPILLLGAPEAAARTPRGWAAAPMLGPVRARQRAMADELGLGFWDWARAMGGPGAASRWVAAGLMRPDHVHFTRAGGARIAAILDADLEDGD